MFALFQIPKMGIGSSSGYSYVATAQWLLDGSTHYGSAGFARASRAFQPLPEDLSACCFIVTGANSGLGKQTALDLALKRAAVHLVCRSKERGEEALADLRRQAPPGTPLELHICDFSSMDSVKAFAAQWEARKVPLHGLILNAGFIAPRYELVGGLESSWATAMSQSYLLSGLLLPSLLRASEGPAAAASGAPLRSPPARIIHVSSGGGLTVKCDVADINSASKRAQAFDGTLQYAHSKRAQMLLAEAWAARVPSARVGVYSMHPGWADTEGVRSSLPEFREKHKASLRSVQQGADTIVWLASAPALPEGASGKLFFDRAEASQHFALAGTTSSSAEKEALWRNCAAACAWEFKS